MEGFHRFLHCQHIRKGAIILGFILFPSACGKNPGKVLLHRHFDIRISLIILQHDIIMRAMLFDEGTLQNQSLHFRIGDNIFEFLNMGHHGTCLCRMVPTALEILAYPIPQVNGFSHIDNFSGFIFHQIYTGFLWEFLQFFRNIEHILTSFFVNFFLIFFCLSFFLTKTITFIIA